MIAKDRIELRDAIKRGWLRDRRRQNFDLHNAFYQWCKAHDRPFVVINARRSYASVSIDMISVDRNLTEPAVAAVKALLMPFLTRSGFIGYGHVYSVAQHVPIDEADELAGALVALASDPANTRDIGGRK